MKHQPQPGKYRVLYARDPMSVLDREPLPTEGDLLATHVFVRAIQATCLDEVYWLMQGEQWSPNGEARPLIERLDLGHTSLSIGDVVQAPDGRYYICRWLDWEELEAHPEPEAETETGKRQ